MYLTHINLSATTADVVAAHPPARVPLGIVADEAMASLHIVVLSNGFMTVVAVVICLSGKEDNDK